MFFNKLSFLLATIAIACSSITHLLLAPMTDAHSVNLLSKHANSIVPVARANAIAKNIFKPKSQLEILLPLYIYPNWYDRDKYLWREVTAAAKKVPITAIINPNDGPNGAPPNTDYQRGIADLRRAGVKIVGYVPTNYGKRDLKAVNKDIDLYAKYFHVDGIFLDEAASQKDQIGYYRKLYKYIKFKHRLSQVIINPGTDVDEGYFIQKVADVMVIFENYQRHWMKYHPPSYTKKYSSQRLAALIHTSNNRVMKSSLDRALQNKLGYIYITNDSTDTTNRNPWDSLPTYWQSQVNYIQKLNRGR